MNKATEIKPRLFTQYAGECPKCHTIIYATLTSEQQAIVPPRKIPIVCGCQIPFPELDLYFQC